MKGEAVSWLNDVPFESAWLGLVLLFCAAWVVQLVCRQVVIRGLGALIRRSPTQWDDQLLNHGFFNRLSWLLPPIVILQALPLVSNLSEGVTTAISRLAAAWIAIQIAVVISAFLTAANAIYSSYPQAKSRPIKGLLQVISIVFYIAAAVFAIAALADRSPALLLSGLGALSAVAMLVFRDTLLSFVAGVQITTNGLIKVGDWIEMPQFNADGDVIDIALNTVQVQNWDKTITSIPTHKFLENSFKNWQGMREFGGRRIKRSILIDVSTIRFLEPDEVDHFGRFFLLKDYIAQKKAELEAHNRQHVTETTEIVNVRRLSNIGTFRSYIVNYLRQHPGIHQEKFSLVRQLQPTGEGLPIEIYAFTNDVAWGVYENTQSDIFDHVISVAPAFGLRLFQIPTGHDLGRVGRGLFEPPNEIASAPAGLMDPPAGLVDPAPAQTEARQKPRSS